MATNKLKEKETDYQLAICNYLQLRGYFFWRQNTTPTFDKGKMVFRPMPKYSKKGVPDILLIKDGQFIGLEVKKPKGVQSEHQKIFEEELTKIGKGKYYLVTTIDDVQKIGL